MERYKFAAYASEDIALIKPRELEAEAVKLRGFSLDDMYARGPALTCWVDGVPVGAGGIIILYPGMGEGWVYAGPQLFELGLSFARSFKYCFLAMMTDWKLRRVQTTADCRYPEHARFLRFLGMQREGLLRKYGPCGVDHEIYAKVL